MAANSSPVNGMEGWMVPLASRICGSISWTWRSRDWIVTSWTSEQKELAASLSAPPPLLSLCIGIGHLTSFRRSPRDEAL